MQEDKWPLRVSPMMMPKQGTPSEVVVGESTEGKRKPTAMSSNGFKAMYRPDRGQRSREPKDGPPKTEHGEEKN